jgi:hypothetical protein
MCTAVIIRVLVVDAFHLCSVTGSLKQYVVMFAMVMVVTE